MTHCLDVEAAGSGDLPPKLHTLYLSDNRFHEFPASIPATLVKLDLSHNCLESVPAWLSRRCVALTALMLQHNGFQILDDAILSLPKLQLLSLHHSPVCDGPSPVAAALAKNASVGAIKQALTMISNRSAHPTST